MLEVVPWHYRPTCPMKPSWANEDRKCMEQISSSLKCCAPCQKDGLQGVALKESAGHGASSLQMIEV